MSLLRVLKIYVLIFILGGVFGSGFYFGRYEQIVPSVAGQAEIEANQSNGLNLSLLFKTLQLLKQNYLNQEKLDPQKLTYGAVAGMVAALDDPYTAFYTPDENIQFKEGLEGIYEGIGAQLGFRDHQLVIVAPLRDSPAQAAGVLAGDEIWAVDGEETVGWSLPRAVSKIRGVAGVAVTLTLRRGELDPKVTFDLDVERQRISVPSVLVKWVGETQNTAHLQVMRFGTDTRQQWQGVVDEITRHRLKGVVLDVRNNPGGYLDAATFMASEFFDGGVVTQREQANGSVQDFVVDHRAGLTQTPVVVLINSGSASASEIVACAIQTRGRGQLVGVTSFGKGTIQEAVDLDNGAGVHITSARWLCPDGRSVDGEGLKPDVMIEMGEENVKAGEDPQLDKAIELLEQSD